ncbi:MAG: hypothetical protein JNK94_00845 [Hyphomonadaceae bacterium]|nr:hypothetical protein [Hyphomonadaceae bacterium]
MAEPLNATFYAFRKRERGGVLTAATIGFFVGCAVLIGAFVALFWGALSSFMSWYWEILSGAVTGDAAALANTGFPMEVLALLPGMLIWVFLFYILYAAYEAACLRWMVRGETGGFLGLTLGADTWRVYVTYWVWFGLYLAGSTAQSILMVAIVSVLAVSGAGAGADLETMGGAGAAAIGLLYLVYYGAMLFFAVRFAPAAATSIARKRFSFFDAWTVTKGRFWAVLGAFFLLYLLYAVFSIVVGVIGFFAVFGALAPHLMQMFTSAAAGTFDIESLREDFFAAFASPATWAAAAVWQIVSWIGAMVFYVAAFGVNARAAAAALEEGKIKVADAAA